MAQSAYDAEEADNATQHLGKTAVHHNARPRPAAQMMQKLKRSIYRGMQKYITINTAVKMPCNHNARSWKLHCSAYCKTIIKQFCSGKSCIMQTYQRRRVAHNAMQKHANCTNNADISRLQCSIQCHNYASCTTGAV